jgi:hypothetical protein
MMNLQEKRTVSEFRQRIKKKMSELRMMTEFRKRMKRKMSPQMNIALHQSRYCSELSGLETPSKYEY